MMNIPDDFKKDIEKAIKILREIGFSELFLFGSLAENSYGENSDIDLAVKGLRDDNFFYALGRLDYELDHRIDLINLDKDTYFNKVLKERAGLIKIA